MKGSPVKILTFLKLSDCLFTVEHEQKIISYNFSHMKYPSLHLIKLPIFVCQKSSTRIYPSKILPGFVPSSQCLFCSINVIIHHYMSPMFHDFILKETLKTSLKWLTFVAIHFIETRERLASD